MWSEFLERRFGVNLSRCKKRTNTKIPDGRIPLAIRVDTAANKRQDGDKHLTLNHNPTNYVDKAAILTNSQAVAAGMNQKAENREVEAKENIMTGGKSPPRVFTNPLVDTE